MNNIKNKIQEQIDLFELGYINAYELVEKIKKIITKQ